MALEKDQSLNKKEKTKKRITQNISRWMNENWDNTTRYYKFRDFTFKNELPDQMISACDLLNKPPLKFNIMESFLDRLRGEFAENMPQVKVSIQDGVALSPEISQLRHIIEDHFRYIIDETARNGVQIAIFDEVSSGGFSVMQITPEYNDGLTMRQRIVWKKSYDSTKAGFDVLAREPSKKDSKFCFDSRVYDKETFESDWNITLDKSVFSDATNGDKFKWYFRIGEQEMVVVCDYYEVVTNKYKIVELSDGKVIKESEYEDYVADFKSKISNFGLAEPIIVDERMYDDKKVMRYKITGNKILEEEELKYTDDLPLIWFDGNSVVLGDEQRQSKLMTRPYLMNCEGTQKLMDVVGMNIADEIQNVSRHKLLIAEESVSPEYIDHIKKPQIYDTLIYRAFYNNDPSKPNPAPVQMARTAFPQEMLAIFQYIPSLIETILGTHSNALAQQTAPESGTAAMVKAINSSATAKPLFTKYIISLNRALEVTLKMMPKVYKGEMSLPVLDRQQQQQSVMVNGNGQPSLDFDPNIFKIKVEASTGVAAQKAQALMQITQLCGVLPGFAAFIQEKGLSVIIDNIEIRGSDVLKELSTQYMQEMAQKQAEMMRQQQQMMQQQQAQGNPLMMREVTKRMELQQKAHEADVNHSIEAAKLGLALGDQKLKREDMQIKAHSMNIQNLVEVDKADASKQRSAVEYAIKMADTKRTHERLDQEFAHRKDHMSKELKHKIADTILKHSKHEASETPEEEMEEHL